MADILSASNLWLNVQMNKRILFISGVILGALSWAICPLVSDRFEPFDTGIGYFIGQFVMLIFVSYVGWSSNIKKVFLKERGQIYFESPFSFLFKLPHYGKSRTT